MHDLTVGMRCVLLADEIQRNRAVIFREYYRHQFRTDIGRFMLSIPAESRNHDFDKSIFTIQYERLTKDTNHLDVIPPDHRAHFAIALFLSVLADVVCYTHFKQEYPRFRALTLYPKFIGNCPGGCHYHLHPSEIFAAINFSRDGRNNTRRPDVAIYNLLEEARSVMKEEVFDFFTNHTTTISAQDFWMRCVSVFPYETKHDNQTANKELVRTGDPRTDRQSAQP